jgi:hypothetical protein
MWSVRAFVLKCGEKQLICHYGCRTNKKGLLVKIQRDWQESIIQETGKSRTGKKWTL